LFSGTSKIGLVRVDLERPEATINTDVFKWLETSEAKQKWDICILDPPYKIENADNKLKGYADVCSVSASVPKRQALEKFFKEYCNNVVWLDFCCPMPNGFKRKKIWFLLQGGYRPVRVLNWLERIE
jgi:hypothetical protein